MMSEKELFLKGIGSIKLVKSEKAKQLNICIQEFKGIRVSMPRFTPFHEAERFVYEKADWIKKSYRRMKQWENRFTIFDENTDFSTRKHKLKFVAQNRENVRVLNQDGIIYILYPKEIDVKDKRIQLIARRGIEMVLMAEGKEFLPKRVKELAKRFDFSYNKVSIRNNKTRWGSCSYQNNISLNAHLMRLPDRLIDYVILHELCHTIKKDHSKNFWDLMEKVMPKSKIYSKELAGWRLQIY